MYCGVGGFLKPLLRSEASAVLGRLAELAAALPKWRLTQAVGASCLGRGRKKKNDHSGAIALRLWGREAAHFRNLRTADRKANEWGPRLFIASVDVEKTFGHFQAYSEERALLEHRPPAWAIAAMLREIMEQKLGRRWQGLFVTGWR